MEVVLRRLNAIEEFKVNVVLERALLESAISIKWITLLLARGLVLKNYERKVILLYRCFNTTDSVEDNNDMSSASASEAQPIGGEVKRYQISQQSSETMTATI